MVRRLRRLYGALRTLLVVTALSEATAGVALLIRPSIPAALLLGASLDGPAAVTIARVGGAALLTLAVACWLARHDGRAAARLVTAMVVYNVAAAAILTLAGLGAGPAGIALWPAVVLHAALALWCLTSLRRAREC